MNALKKKNSSQKKLCRVPSVYLSTALLPSHFLLPLYASLWMTPHVNRQKFNSESVNRCSPSTEHDHDPCLLCALSPLT